MIYSSEKSILFDTVYYFDLFFNKGIIRRELINSGLDENVAFKAYNSVGFDVNEIYRAFFDFGSNRNSFAVFLLFGHIDRINTVDEFIDILKDKEYIIEYISTFYANKSFIDIEETFLLRVEAKIRASLIAIISNYETVLNRLVDDLKSVNVCMQRYYANNFDSVRDFENLDDYIKIIRDYGGNMDEIDCYGISLMNTFYFKKCRKVWVFGAFASSEQNSTHNLKNVTLESVLDTLSGGVYMDIIDMLYKNNNCLSANQMMDEINWSQAVLYRGLSYLCSEKAIFLKKEKNVNYYSINPEYFKKAEYVVSEKCRYLYHVKNNFKMQTWKINKI